MIGVIGAGVTGSRVVEHLVASGQVHIYVNDINPVVAHRVVEKFSRATHKVSAVSSTQMLTTNVVVLACPAPHAKAARRLLEAGVSVVSCSDDVEDTLALLDLDGACRLVCFDTSNKSVAQFLYGWRPEVNVVKLIFKGLIVMDFNSFLQGTFNHSNFAVGLESIHVASEHANAFPFVNVAGAVVFNLV